MLIPVQCIEAVMPDIQTRVQHTFKYHDNDIFELTGDVKWCKCMPHSLIWQLCYHMCYYFYATLLATSFKKEISTIWWHASHHGSTHSQHRFAGIGYLRKKNDTIMQIQSVRSARHQSDKKLLQNQFGISGEPNLLLKLAVDPHEYLHKMCHANLYFYPI